MKSLRKLFAWASAGKRALRDIPGCLAVLPVLRAQLHETSQQVEEAVVGVCGNFTGIAARARRAVAQTAELLGGDQQDSDATVERSIETSRLTIAGLLERVERAGQMSSLVISSMQEIEATAVGIESLLSEVQRIAFLNKIVALNAKIEAVHVGQLGSGFEVVADEISRQSARSDELAEGIGDRIGQMRERVRSAAANLRECVAQDRAKLDESRHNADTALTLLWSLHQKARECLSRMTGENQSLADDISSAVVALQFQDRVKQRVAHVMSVLQSVEGVLGSEVGSEAARPERAIPTPALVAEMHAAYSMEAERSVMNRPAVQSAPASSDMEVELF